MELLVADGVVWGGDRLLGYHDVVVELTGGTWVRGYQEVEVEVEVACGPRPGGVFQGLSSSSSANPSNAGPAGLGGAGVDRGGDQSLREDEPNELRPEYPSFPAAALDPLSNSLDGFLLNGFRDMAFL